MPTALDDETGFEATAVESGKTLTLTIVYESTRDRKITLSTPEQRLTLDPVTIDAPTTTTRTTLKKGITFTLAAGHPDAIECLVVITLRAKTGAKKDRYVRVTIAE